jgi:Transposase DDE domain/Domain of unknown function (DUF4372)
MYAHTTTIFNQLLDFVPKDRFNRFVGQHKADRYVKSLTTWNQFVALLYAQATGKDSLREIETGFSAHQNLWYHLGVASVARSTLSYANSRRDWRIFHDLFGEILGRCRDVTPHRNKFAFDNPLYALDATVISLCLSTFNWATYRKTKGALKLHMLLDVRTAIPEIIVMTEGKISDITAGKRLNLSMLEKGSILVFDRGYIDYGWWHELKKQDLFFVSRSKTTSAITVLGQHRPPDTATGILKDDRVFIGEHSGYEAYPEAVRCVAYHDTERGETFTYLTNNFELSASDIALIYKNRWQVELFFKWIKQHLKIKTFLGTSKNAVLTQIWVAMIYYLLLAYIKFQTKYAKSLLELTRIVRETLLIRRHLVDILALTTRTVARLTMRDGPQMELF